MDRDEIRNLAQMRQTWERDCYGPSLKQSPERLSRFSTVSDLEIEGLYTPEEISQTEFVRDIGFPGPPINFPKLPWRSPRLLPGSGSIMNTS